MRPTITYTIAMPQPHTHLYAITLSIPHTVGSTVDVALPAWTPGSYLIREYARHVQEFSAADAAGQPLPWHKVDKSTWQIQTGGASHVIVRYNVYANELTVRTSHLDGTHAYFNPATLCMYVPGRTNEPLAVQVIAPEGWKVTTALEPDSGHRAADGATLAAAAGVRFLAQDYDELVDSPFECGTHRLLSFEVDGIPHEIALWGRGNVDETQLVADTRKIIEVTRAMFGGLPYRRYVSIIHLADGRGGGLEHRNSMSLLVDRWTFRPHAAYERFLGLLAHEFFHVWNVKRIRAAPLGPFDYSRENHTRQLWAMEGVTSYYGDLLLLRAGLISPERFLELLAEKITNLQGQPGRLLQSLEQSSFDAWIKLYRPDEHSPNSSISYYLKGELVALLLDLELRHRSRGARSLDDVLRYLYQRYPVGGPGIPEEGGYLAAVEAVGAPDSYAGFFARYIAGTEELDYARALAYAGLRPIWSYKNASDDGQAPAWLGLRTKVEHGQLRVATVLADGPASAAGIYAGDELVALDGYRVDEESLAARLSERRPGDYVTLSLFRRNELLHIPVQLAAAPFDRLVIAAVEQPDETQLKLRAAWIGM